jgi:hypothetical protein
MQVEEIIANLITDDIRSKGHLSIRLKEDGFSFMVSDASFKPVLLKNYRYKESIPVDNLPAECGRILESLQLIDFPGETVIITDSQSFTLIPETFFDGQYARTMLEKSGPLNETDIVSNRLIRGRRLMLLFAYKDGIRDLAGRMTGGVHVIHTAECVVSLSDQVQASDHQRGFVLAEVQTESLHLMVIREDGIVLLNRYVLRDPSDSVYHVLNAFRQLDLDRERIPVYLSGIIHPEHELFGLLGKYIRIIKTTPYYLEELSKTDVLRFMILSEGSKCV